MNCPKCKYEFLSPYRTDFGPEDERWYRCPECHFTGPTVEKWKSTESVQAWQAYLFTTLCEANGSREKAREVRAQHEGER